MVTRIVTRFPIVSRVSAVRNWVIKDERTEILIYFKRGHTFIFDKDQEAVIRKIAVGRLEIEEVFRDLSVRLVTLSEVH